MQYIQSRQQIYQIVIEVAEIVGVNLMNSSRAGIELTELLIGFIEKNARNYIEDGLRPPFDPFIDALCSSRLGVKTNNNDDEIQLEHVLTCSECTSRAANINCLQCKDVFCNSCFEICHMGEGRKNHITDRIEQRACEVCHASNARVEAQLGDHAMKMCQRCWDREMTSDGSLTYKRRRCLELPKCLECGDGVGEVVCEDCKDLVCTFCYTCIHHRGRMNLHTPIYIYSERCRRSDGRYCALQDLQTLVDSVMLRAKKRNGVMFLNETMSSFKFMFGPESEDNQNT
jgi:hypothetical protein